MTTRTVYAVLAFLAVVVVLGLGLLMLNEATEVRCSVCGEPLEEYEGDGYTGHALHHDCLAREGEEVERRRVRRERVEQRRERHALKKSAEDAATRQFLYEVKLKELRERRAAAEAREGDD